MNLGELIDKIDEVRKAEEDVEKAELALRHGGNEETMRGKRQWLADCLYYLGELRCEEL